jgi:uncharacterized membrane protein YjgN (DUF898 family)
LGIVAFFAFAFYFARALKYVTNNTSFRNVTLAARFTTWDYMRLLLGNVFVLLFTLGLGTPFVAHRLTRFMCRYLYLQGAEDLESLSQSQGRRQAKGGEGLVQLLDSGGFA